jgi:hypothetical protein
VPLFVFTLNGRRTRVKELRSPLMKQRGNFIKRWNSNGWIWRPVPRSSSVWICSSKLWNFASVCHRLIYAPIVMNECRLKPSKRSLNLKSTPSNVHIVARSIGDVFALMTSPVDGVSADSFSARPSRALELSSRQDVNYQKWRGQRHRENARLSVPKRLRELHDGIQPRSRRWSRC